MYVGLNIVQTSSGIWLDQNSYIKGIQEIPLTGKDGNEPLSKEEKTSIRSVSGQLLWVTNHTRPDIAYKSCFISNLGKHATRKDITKINKVVRNLKHDDIRVKFSNLGECSKWKIIAYKKPIMILFHQFFKAKDKPSQSTVFLVFSLQWLLNPGST